MDLSEGIERFLLQLRANGRSEHTSAQYTRHLLVFGRWASTKGLSGDVCAIDHRAVARFLTDPVALSRPDGQPKKATSVNALRGSLRGFFGYLHEAGYVAEDPSRLVRRASCGSPPPRSLSASDQRRLLKTLIGAKGEAAARDHALFHFLLTTGVRLSAALALDIEDLDLDGGEALLRRSKGDRVERVFLPPALLDHLRTFLAERKSGPVFTIRRGQPISRRHAHRRLQHWLIEAGCKAVPPHGLRHTFATTLYQRTRDLLLVRRALGHRSIGSTLRYARVKDDELREALRA